MLPSTWSLRNIRRLHLPGYLFWGICGGLALFALFVSRAEARTAAQDFTFTPDLAAWPLVVPMVAAATSVERGLELFWNFTEWFLLRVGGWQAEDLKRADYQQFKSGFSLLLANLLGVAITSYTDVRVLSYLQPEVGGLFDQVPVSWDILLSGLLIGSATKPVHDALGMFTRLKTLLGSLSQAQRERAGVFAAETVQRLQESHTHSTQSLVPHQPTVRTAASPPSPAAPDTAPPTRQSLHNDMDGRYNL